MLTAGRLLWRAHPRFSFLPRELDYSNPTGSQASQSFPKGSGSMGPLCIIKTRYCACSAEDWSFYVLCIFPFKQDTTPKSAPVLARGSDKNLFSSYSLCTDWPLTPPLRSLVSVCPVIPGRFMMSASDMSEALPTLRGGPWWRKLN